MENRGRKFKLPDNTIILEGKLENHLELCTIREMASRTGYKTQTIRDWIRRGKIESFIFKDDPIRRVHVAYHIEKGDR